MKQRIYISSFFISIVIFLSACSKNNDENENPLGVHDQEHSQQSNHAPLLISNAWVRPTVEGQKVTAAYMKVSASVDGKIIGAISNVAGIAEFHEMKMIGDVMQMRKLDLLEIKKGQSISLEPNGYHVMLLDLKKSLKEGQNIDMIVIFESSKGKKFEIPVQAFTTMKGIDKTKH